MPKMILSDLNPNTVTWEEVVDFDFPGDPAEVEEAAYLRAGEDIEIIEDGVAVIVELDASGQVIASRPYGPPPSATVLSFQR